MKEERLKYIISLLGKIYPDEKIDQNFKLRGTFLWKLCEFNGPGYQRVKEWAEIKIKEIENKQDTTDFKKILMDCYKLMLGRNKKYGDSWKQLEIKSIIDLVLMKLTRVKNQDLDIDSIKIETEDCINYLIFLLLKIKK